MAVNRTQFTGAFFPYPLAVSTPEPETPVAPPRTLAELFWGFASIGARSFGGVLPWAHRALVEERRWITPADFAETVGLCLLLPGPNIGNASIVLGKRWFGLRGAVVAFLGLFAFPFVWVLALAALYTDLVELPLVRATVTGAGIAGAGLLIGTALKLGQHLARRPAAIAIVAACFVAVGVARISLVAVLPVAALLALAAARRGWL
jgi:chromate transporter